jgi:hypothetical protein
VKKRSIFPIKIRADEIVCLIKKPAKEHPEYATWISEATWTIMDAKSEARRSGDTLEAKRLARILRRRLKADKKARIEAVAVEIEALLTSNEVHKAYSMAS